MPATRLSAIVVVMIALLMVACGQPTANGQVIGVRPASTPTPVPQVPFDASGIDAMLTAQIAAADSAQAIQGPVLPGELPIDIVLTLRQLENLALLQQLGNVVISKRLAALASVRSQVLNDRLMSSYQKYAIISGLDAAAAGLNATQVKIAQDLLVDQARADITSVATFRVHGFLVPQAHMLIAAYDLVQLGAVYGNEHANLQNYIYTSGVSGQQAIDAQAAVDDLGRQAATLSRLGYAAVYVLQGLTAAGYPGNKGTLLSARPDLVAGKGVNSQAAADANRARSILGI